MQFTTVRSGAALLGVLAMFGGVARAQLPAEAGAAEVSTGTTPGVNRVLKTALASMTPPNYAKGSASDLEASTWVLSQAALAPSPLRIADANPASIGWIPARLPLAFPPQASGANTPQASVPNPPKQPNWARRHTLLLMGLAATGAGAALMATGGPGQAALCGPYGLYGSYQCTTGSSWGFSSQHLAGILLVSAGVPLAIWGLIRH
jgi:hypothetical protein